MKCLAFCFLIENFILDEEMQGALKLAVKREKHTTSRN